MGVLRVKPVLQRTAAEAVYMIGMERNSDFVKVAAYAPLLAHLDFPPYTVSPIARITIQPTKNYPLDNLLCAANVFN